MNILVINHYAGSTQHGMEYRHYYLAREWVKLGHNVYIVAASFSHLRNIQPEVKTFIKHELIDGISYLWIKTPKYAGNGARRALNILIFAILLRIFRKKITAVCRPDAIIASSPHPFVIYGASSISRSSKAKLVFEIRDIWPLTLTELSNISSRNPFIKQMKKAEDMAYCVSNDIISLLPRIDPYLAAKGYQNKSIYIPNGIQSSEWKAYSECQLQVASELSKMRAKGKLIIGYTGSHGRANDLFILLEAAALMRNYQVTFALIGSGPEKKKLREKAERIGLDNVLFLDPVPKRYIPDILSLIDILYIGLEGNDIFRYGISPNKLMDYMMSAKPIIQMIQAGNDLVAESGCGVSISVRTPEKIKDAIISLMDMTKAEREAMGFRGRNFVLQYHDYSVLAKKFLQTISDQIN